MAAATELLRHLRRWPLLRIATTRLILQTAVAVLPVREPVVLAKQAATLDLMSGARLILGVGIGAYREEFEAVRPEAHGWHRGQMVDEGMQALRVLLRERRATLPGATCAFATSKCSRNHAKTRCPSGSVAILTTAWCEPLPTVMATSSSPQRGRNSPACEAHPRYGSSGWARSQAIAIAPTRCQHRRYVRQGAAEV